MHTLDAHVSEGDLVMLVREGRSATLHKSSAVHLEACPSCARRLDTLREAWDAFPVAAWNERKHAFFGRREHAVEANHTRWWHEWLTSRRLMQAPSAYPFAHAATPTGTRAATLTPIGRIPGVLERGGVVGHVMVSVTQKPSVGADGQLCLGMLVEEDWWDEGSALEVTLVDIRRHRPLGHVHLLSRKTEQLLVFELPADLRVEWRRIDESSWESLPLRILMSTRFADAAS